jgi:hypothetical protein
MEISMRGASENPKSRSAALWNIQNRDAPRFGKFIFCQTNMNFWTCHVLLFPPTKANPNPRKQAFPSIILMFKKKNNIQDTTA